MNKKFWLKVCKDLGNLVFEKVRELKGIEESKRVLKRGFSGDKTLVIDEMIERLVIDSLSSLGKRITLISEEIGVIKIGEGEPEAVIVLDPLDGSNNFKFGFPFVSTSIAVCEKCEKMRDVEVGYVINLISGKEYYATKGGGSFSNEEKIKVSKEKMNCLLIDIVSERKHNFKRISRVGEFFKFVRMFGSCCLGICYVAEGSADAYLGLGGKRTIDPAASQLIIKEAGGVVKDLEGKDFSEYDIGFNVPCNVIAASSKRMYEEIKSILVD